MYEMPTSAANTAEAMMISFLRLSIASKSRSLSFFLETALPARLDAGFRLSEFLEVLAFGFDTVAI
jgi:hypothetical protein